MSAMALRAAQGQRPAPTVEAPASGEPALEPLVTKFDVAARLGVHFSTVERLIKTDALPVYRLGPPGGRQQLRFRWSEVDAWLRERQEGVGTGRGGVR